MVDRIQRPDRIGSVHSPPTPSRSTSGRNEFSSLLTKEMTGIKFSSHATARLRSRGIELGTEELGRLKKAVDLAATKGARDALVLVDDVAMVVSVINRTVVTALDREQAKTNVFTNIDSAVIT